MKKKEEKKNNKKKIIIISIIVAILLIIALIILLLPKKEKEKEPYVIEKEIEILSAKDEYTTTAEPYFKDENKNVIDVDGITVKISTITYKFLDYAVSEPDENNYVIYSFKIDATTPIEYTEIANKKYPYHKYTYLFSQPSIFDYYTGDICKEKHVSTNNTVNFYDINDHKDEDMAYTDITWKDKTYKIGVRIELSAKWDGIQKEKNNDGTNTVRDTHRSTVNMYVYAPKDYDGLMIFLKKSGTTKQDFLDILDYSNKYNELVKEYNETGEKSSELTKMEENNNKTFKLLENKSGDGSEYPKDSFYVLRVNDITPKES